MQERVSGPDAALSVRLVDVTGIEHVYVGMTVTLIGRDGDQEITAPAVAAQAEALPAPSPVLRWIFPALESVHPYHQAFF